MLEFVETPSYQASKEAQKMQSEVSPFGLFSTVQRIFDVLSLKEAREVVQNVYWVQRTLHKET